MSNFLFRVLIFLVLNFSALIIGGWFTSQGVNSNWYTNMNQAPWTPPGWVFGFAWTTIMIAFAFYMAFLLGKSSSKVKIMILFFIQFILNISWNIAFFYNHNIMLGLVIILSLTFIVGLMLLTYIKPLKYFSILIAPYLLWLFIASSLNLYILIAN